MKRLELRRFFYGTACTLGYFALPDRIVYTMEDAWKSNQAMLSCIPDGVYRCVPRHYNKGGYPAVEITGVPGRSTILFHKGNTADDVTGCIVVGSALGVMGGQLAVLWSADVFTRFMVEFGGAEFDLEIKPVPPLKGTK